MRTKSFLIALILAMTALVNTVKAQFSFPKFDVEIKGGYSHVNTDKSINGAFNIDNPYTINIQGAIHWQVTQNIGIGWTYSNSLAGEITYKQNDNGAQTKYNISMMMNGPQVRISAGRIKDWRPYLILNYQKVEFIEDKGSYRLSHKTNSFGGGIGIMRKFGNKLYWNVLEVSAQVLSEQIYWITESDLILQAKTGVTYNFGKQK